jgi:hypothetical protein
VKKWRGIFARNGMTTMRREGYQIKRNLRRFKTMKTKTYEVYSYDELSEEQKRKA